MASVGRFGSIGVDVVVLVETILRVGRGSIREHQSLRGLLVAIDAHSPPAGLFVAHVRRWENLLMKSRGIIMGLSGNHDIKLFRTSYN